MKKTTIALFALLLLLAATSAVHGQLYYTNANGGVFTYSTNTPPFSYTITGYSGPGGAVIFPTIINHLLVNGVGDGEPVFSNTVVTSVTLPGVLMNIGDDAFFGCPGLTNVMIPIYVTNIGTEAFEGCTSLSTVLVPSYVSSVGTAAFQACPNLSNVYFTGNAPVTGSNVFCGDSVATVYYLPGTMGWNSTLSGFPVVESPFNFSLNGNETINITGYIGPGGVVAIPNEFGGGSVTTIGQGAFFQCESVASVTIPNSVTSIGDDAFESCYNLLSVTIPGSVMSIGQNAFSGCYALTNATLGDGVASIGEDAFSVCSGLTSVTIPGTVASIGDDAFFACTNLANITIANGVISIGGRAFEDCTSLTSVTIPNSVTNIYLLAFADCSSLTNVTIGTGMTNLGGVSPGVFSSCTKLNSVFFAGNAPTATPHYFNEDPATIYYLPGTLGWSNTFAGLPALLWNPLIQTADGSFGVQSNQFGFNITGTANIPIVVEAATDLTCPVWTPLTNINLTNGLFYFSDPQWANYPNRYYNISSPLAGC
jgi:hypothetical protein